MLLDKKHSAYAVYSHAIHTVDTGESQLKHLTKTFDSDKK